MGYAARSRPCERLAFLVSISGAGVPPAETTIDQARNEMMARGLRPEGVRQLLELMKLQYEYAQTGQGFDAYASAREKLAARMGRPPDTFPGTPDDPYWEFIRRLYFYDPAPTIRQLRLPVLAIFGELDNNILAEKNKAAWEAALDAGGNRDYNLRILPKADHPSLRRRWEATRKCRHCSDSCRLTLRPLKTGSRSEHEASEPPGSSRAE